MTIQFLHRFCIGLVCTLFAQVALAQAGSAPVDPAKLMQSNQTAIDAVDAAVAATKYNDARDQVAVMRKNFMALRSHWSAQGRTDVLRTLSEGMDRFSMLEELLGRPKVSVERVQAVSQELRKDVLAKLPKS